MKKTLHIDDALLADAKRACAASTDAETVRLRLEALIRHAAYRQMRALAASERGADVTTSDVPRRRERPVARRTKKRSGG